MKRSYQVQSKYTKGSARAKRMAIPYTPSLRKPEVKDLVIAKNVAQLDNGNIDTAPIFDLITLGASGAQRIGDQIRVLSIEVAGRAMGEVNNASFVLVCPNEATRVPLLTDFADRPGNLMDLSHGWVLMHHIRDSGSLNCLQVEKYTFPKGMIVKYDRRTDISRAIKNQVYSCTINTTGANVTAISYSIRIRYVDF